MSKPIIRSVRVHTKSGPEIWRVKFQESRNKVSRELIWKAYPVGKPQMKIRITYDPGYGLIGLYGGSEGPLRIRQNTPPNKLFSAMVREFWS